MLLLWMVILAKTPFDLTRFDGSRAGDTLVGFIYVFFVVYLFGVVFFSLSLSYIVPVGFLTECLPPSY